MLIWILSFGIVLGATLLTPLVRAERSPRLATLWPALMTFWAVVVLVELVAARAGTGLHRLGHWLSVSSAALAAVPVVWLRIGRRAIALGVVLVATLLGLANVAFSRRFGSPLPIELVAQIGDVWRVRGAALESLAAGDGLLFAPLLAVSVAAFLGRAVRARVEPVPSVLCLIAGLPVVVHAGHAATRSPHLPPVPALAARDGFLAMHLLQVARSVAFKLRAGRLDQATRGRIARFAAARRGPSSVEGAGVARGKNVVLIQVESLNSWVVDLKVGGIEVAPTLSALARRGLFFPNVFDQTAAGRSADADHLVLVSQHPLPQAPIAAVAAEHEVVALPSVLRQVGYRSTHVGGEPRGLWGAARRSLRYGFDRALFAEDLAGDRRLLKGGSADRVIFEKAAALASERNDPWLLRISTFSTHSPHQPLPSELDEIDLGELEGTALGNYLDTVRYFDSALRAFLERLPRETLLVIHGDHTESFGFDRERLGQLAGVHDAKPGSELRLKLVPLLIVYPGLETIGRVEHLAGLIDVGPTILSLLGVERPASFFGTPLQNGGASLVARWDGLVLGRPSWTSKACVDWPLGSPLPAHHCDAVRAAARQELEISWLVTRHGLASLGRPSSEP